MDNIERERLKAGLITLKALQLKHPKSLCIINGIQAIEQKLKPQIPLPLVLLALPMISTFLVLWFKKITLSM
jgi:hypothetical protein